jgi:ribose transport system permease protein
MTQRTDPPTGATVADVVEGAGVSVDLARSPLRRLLTSPVIVTFIALAVIIIVFSVLAPGTFGTTSNFTQLAQNVAILTVVSVGTTFVIVTAGVDLSIPSGIVLGEVFAVRALGLVKVADGTAVDVGADQSKLSYMLVALAGALLAGLPDGIAVVVAVKALGRYPELRAAGASERFITGTLASLLWAAAAAGTGRLLLQ